MKLLDQYHNKFKCKGHTKENTLFRLVGLILFVVIFSGLWMVPTKSVLLGIVFGVFTTVLLDIIGGIGRGSDFFKG